MSWVGNSEAISEASKGMNEHNDCTVRAWCNVFDCDYALAHAYLRRHGRRDRKGMLPRQIKAALGACRKATIRIGPYTRTQYITVSKFVKKHPVGRYYVWNRNHAFCIKDGVVHDYQLGPRRQITFAARVYLEGEL
jgi:hypothetical protein